jgi:uncharacterized protein
MNNAQRPHLLGVVAGIFLAAGLICSAIVVTTTWLKVAESQSISVTGSARKAVRSDLIVWHGSFSVEGKTLLAAQQSLKVDLEKVESFLKKNQVTNFVWTPIAIQEVRARDKGQNESQERIVGYRLTQSVEIRSEDVDRITRLNRDSAALVEQGVLFAATEPAYIYTKAGETKVEMLAEATKDARARAEQIAVQGGRRIHQLRSAKMGVFQITPMHSIQTSWEGMNDTSSLDKTITAVVSATFSMN